MTTTAPNPTSRTPPQLNYLVIYNPTLKPLTPVKPGQDEDDAIEQSHILFYTARETAVSKDTMLRQVGLAKALINFSEMFTADEVACDAIHSQRKRLVMIEPEKDYWIHASVDVAFSPRSAMASNKGKPTNKNKGKEKEKATFEATPFEYHENSLHDDVLRSKILQGYQEFRLLHDSFSNILTSSGQSALESLLERFWSLWAWKWEVGSPPSFAAYLGLSLRDVPHLQSFPTFRSISSELNLPPSPVLPSGPSPSPSDILASLYSQLPSESIPLVLSLVPPAVLPLRPTAPYPPDTLPRYLLTVIPPPRPRTKSMSSSVSTIGPQATKQNPLPKDKGIASSTQASPSPSGNGLSIMSGMAIPHLNVNLHLASTMEGLGTVANPKKWGWGTWSFGKNAGRGLAVEKGREDPDNSEQESPAVEEGNVESDVVEEPSHPEIGGANPEQDIGTEVNADKTPTAPTISLTADFPLLAPRPTVAVNQGLLEDAMSDNEPDHTLGDTTHDEPFSEGSANPSTSDVSVITSDDSIFTKDAETVPISSSPSSQVSNGPEIAPPPNPPFNTLWIHIDEEDGPEFEGHSEKDEAKVIRTTRRKVLYMTRDRLVLALVLPLQDTDTKDNSSDQALVSWLDELDYKVYNLLGELQNVLEMNALLGEHQLVGRSDSKGNETSTSPSLPHRWVTRSSGSTPNALRLVDSSPGFETSSSHYFGMRNVLVNSNPSIREVISRAQNLRWFAAKRGVPISILGKPDESGHDGEVYVEVASKEASLVDVDYEVDKVLMSSKRLQG